MANEGACEKKIRLCGIFFTPIHVYKERRKLKTYYLQDRDKYNNKIKSIQNGQTDFNYFLL